MSQQNLSSFIWSVAVILRGDHKQSKYGRAILPFTVLRRLDCVLKPTKEAVLSEKKKRESAGINSPVLTKEIMNTMDFQSELSTRAFNSAEIRESLKSSMLNQLGLCEKLKSRAAGA
nr:type I restriction-modification system subunit M N-terminal domain-containing protein [Gimesia benthica]